MDASASASSLTFFIFSVSGTLILLSSLIVENHNFHEGSGNDRPRQHREIIHSFVNKCQN